MIPTRWYRWALFIAIAPAMCGCFARVDRIVVQDEIPSLDDPTVRSVRLVDGGRVEFVGDAVVIGDSTAYAVAGQDSTGAPVVVPRDRIVEAEVRTLQWSFPGMWLATGAVVLGGLFLVGLALAGGH
jgi:hypothetical protein